MTATQQLIDLAARLQPTGEIGDGMVAQFHALALRARFEQTGSCPRCLDRDERQARYESECG